MAVRYRPQVIEHLVRPRNVGELADPSGAGESGDAACGDIARFTVRVEDNVLTAVRYKAYGCAACTSKVDLERSLGGPLALGKEHATTLVLDALHKALEDHLKREAGEMRAE